MKIKPILLSIVMACPGEALQTYKLIDQHKTSIVIAQHQQTRIAVEDDRIQQIFGAEGQLDVQSDEDRGQIFLKPILAGTSPLFLTIVTENGLTQDLKLVPQDIEAQSIVFKPAVLEEKQSPVKKSRSSEIMQLLQAMRHGHPMDAYQKSPLSTVVHTSRPTVRLEPVCLYRGSTLTGRVYTLTNIHQHPVVVWEKTFAMPSDVAILIQDHLLLPKQQTRVFIISTLGEK